MNKYSYNPFYYPFYQEVKRNLGVEIALNYLKVDDEVYKREKDQSSKYHQKWYESDLTEFLSSYKSFVGNEIWPKFQCKSHSEQLVYQTKPTIRFHFPGNLAVGEFHRDRDYNHNPEELNVFLPITAAYDTNTVWVESQEGLEDYQPLNGAYGDFMFFDGANCKHGNKINNTRFCRVSFDFRIMTLSSYEKFQPKKTISQSKSLSVGDYYSVLD